MRFSADSVQFVPALALIPRWRRQPRVVFVPADCSSAYALARTAVPGGGGGRGRESGGGKWGAGEESGERGKKVGEEPEQAEEEAEVEEYAHGPRDGRYCPAVWSTRLGMAGATVPHPANLDKYLRERPWMQIIAESDEDGAEHEEEQEQEQEEEEREEARAAAAAAAAEEEEEEEEGGRAALLPEGRRLHLTLSPTHPLHRSLLPYPDPTPCPYRATAILPRVRIVLPRVAVACYCPPRACPYPATALLGRVRLLCARYAESGSDLGYAATRRELHTSYDNQTWYQPPLSAYAPATRCPVQTYCVVLSAYTHATRCPALA
eukprot:477525-Rhodomonas_salina.3